MNRTDEAAAQYGQVVAPHEFHWNSDIPGSGTCTCSRALDHPLHLQAETTGDHTQTKLDDNPYYNLRDSQSWFGISQLGQHTGSSIPGVPVEVRGAGSLIPPDDSEFFAEPYDYEKAEGTDEYANAYMRTLGRPAHAAHKARRGWTPTHHELALCLSVAAAIVLVAGYLVHRF